MSVKKKSDFNNYRINDNCCGLSKLITKELLEKLINVDDDSEVF